MTEGNAKARAWLGLPSNSHVVTLARAGNPPRQISARTGLSIDAVYKRLARARDLAISVPSFQGLGAQSTDGKPRERGPLDHEDKKPRTDRPDAGAEPDWSADDDARLANLLGRGIRLTAVGAHMRRPYRDIIRAAERLGLTRIKTMET